MRKPRSFFQPMPSRARALASAVVMLVVSACATPHDTSLGENWGRARGAANDEVRRCTDAFATIDHAVDQAGTGDAQTSAIPGFPHLRTTRFLAALSARFRGGHGDQAFDYWTGWLAQTGTKARGYELANLSNAARHALRAKLGSRPETVVADCTSVLMGIDGKRPKYREILTSAVFVPDHYSDLFRTLGMYPLASIPVLIGFERWKDRNLSSFGRPPSSLKNSGSVEHVAPESTMPPMDADDVAALLRGQADNPLNIPRPSKSQLRRLAAGFAPVFAIDVAGSFDRIGAPVLRTDGAAAIDTNTPRVYVQPSWAIIGGVTMFQISYLVWFSERPPSGSLDILAGNLDGLIWRVTIGPDGRPILYDSIHPCGCYHLFFPVPPTRLKDRQVDEPGEGTVVPSDAPVPGPGQRMVLHIGSGNHYLRGLSVSAGEAVGSTGYELVPMDRLRSLPAPNGGRRSLYDPNGLVAGTDRAERWVLWPMGVRSSGAMRQWGTHATAFVGRRHFDDPYVIDRGFTR
jgi:hypothetical protein